MSQCYRQWGNGNVVSFLGVQACTNSTSSSDSRYTSCCFNGHICLENNLCYAPSAAPGTTGYYEALCSDPSYNDPSCAKTCTAYAKGDVVFDASLTQWKCCGNNTAGEATCSNPTTIIYTAPSPNVLLADATGTPTSSSRSTSSTSTAGTSTSSLTATSMTSSSSSTTTSIPADSSANEEATHQRLATGTKAGIAVGIVVVVLAIIGVVVFYMMKKRRQRRNQYTPPPTYNGYVHEAHTDAAGYFEPRKPTNPRVSEMPAATNPAYQPFPNRKPVAMAEKVGSQPHSPNIHDRVHELGG